MKKIALITGVTGQDGAYLAKFLLNKNYKVYGTYRRVSTPNFWRLEYLGVLNKIELIPFDLLDQSSILEALQLAKPDEVYNLAAQSFVGASFEQPVATGEITGLGLTRLLDTIRNCDTNIRFYQASSSELYGNVAEVPQNEKTPFRPKSPYAAAKLYAHWITLNYREAYNLFAVCGILFNHESPLRGVEFVTRKITYNIALIKNGLADKLVLGNLDAKRDWGYAEDYVEAMWLMLQQEKPKDYVIATGKTYTVKEFAKRAFKYAGLDYKNYVEVSDKFLRPSDVDLLLGDPSRAESELGWNSSKTSIDNLIKMMVDSDLKLVEAQKSSVNIYKESNIKLYDHFKE
jgi:GDPmannose 4,6-dehydratase